MGVSSPTHKVGHSMMTFGEMIFWHAIRQPDKPAVIAPGGILTYSGLRNAIGCCALQVQSLGWNSGGTVAILVENRLHFIIVAAALARLGFVTMSALNWRDIQQSGLPLAGVISGQSAPPGNTLPFAQTDDSWFNPSHVGKPPEATPVDPHAVHHVALTSGSTGFPQPFGFDAYAVREHQISHAVIGNTVAWDRLLCIPGPGIYFGYCANTMALVFGKTLVFAKTNSESLRRAAFYGVEWIIASNVQLEGLINQQIARPIALPQLKLVYFGGSLITQKLIQAARIHLQALILCNYGSTESGVIASCAGERLPRKDGATGYVAPWVNIEVVDEERHPLPAGTEGEIRLRTPSQGRIFNPSTRLFEKLDPEEGWLYPGDMGLVQEDGLLVITGRSKEIINAGGVKFAPEILEQAILVNPHVSEAAVVTLPDSRGLGEVWAAIVTDGPVNSDSLQEQCRIRFSAVKIRDFVTVETIPKTELGKTARDEVRKILEAVRESRKATEA
jgi:acyl-coenzyme A synthetase/AMP-(fatty) acid ligase